MNKKKLLLSLLTAILITNVGCTKNEDNKTQNKEERIDPDNKPYPEILECCKKTPLENITLKELSAEELNSIQNDTLEKERYLVIDIRSEDEYKKGHLKYAINMPKDEILNRVGRIRDWSNLNVVIYSNTLEESKLIANKLIEEKFLYVFASEKDDSKTNNFVTYTNLTGSEFQKLIDKNEGVFLDSRDEKDFKKAHQKNAILIDYKNIDEKLLPKDKSQAIYLYDYTGDRSVVIAEKLQSLGYNNITISLDGTKENKFYF